MNYPALADHFWAKRLEHSFTPNDIAVYFALLDHCAALAWKNPFNFSVAELQVKVGLKTKDPLDTARNRLKQAGLIDYRNGQGRGNTSQYALVIPAHLLPEKGEKKGDKKGLKNTPLSPPFSSPFSPPFFGVEKPTVHSSSSDSSKPTTTTTTAGDGGVVVVDKPVKEVTAAEQQWHECQAWMQENAPRCLTLDQSLFTPDALRSFYATYTKAHVQEALRAIHGEASAAKYLCLWTGVNNICRHRYPARAAGRTKAADPQALYGPDNPAVAAELAAIERQETAARQARRTPPHAQAS